MAQPTPYSRRFDFGAYSAAYPNSQQPGAQIDAELNAIRTSLNQALTNLAIIQRDDTHLANNTIGIDQLSDAVLALIGGQGFSVRGSWLADTQYFRGDIFSASNVIYLVMADHVSDADLADDIAAGKVAGPIFDPATATSVMALLAANGGAALVGTDGGVTVETALGQKAASATLAAAAGSSTIGFTHEGASASGTVETALRERGIYVTDHPFNVVPGEADSSAKLQAALDYAATFSRRPPVIIPNTGQRINFTQFTVPQNVTLMAEGGQNWGAVLYHTDPTIHGIILNARARLIDVTVDVNNSDRVTPVQGPPTVFCKGSYAEVRNVRFQDAWIAIGTDTGSAIVAEWIFGFVHHRMILVENTTDVSYIGPLHGQNPDGVAWNSSWYSYSNKILVEAANADGIYGRDWFNFRGKALFTRTGTGNLMTQVFGFGTEASRYGLFIDQPGVTGNEHPLIFSGGYFQTNNDANGVALVYVNTPAGLGGCELHISDALFSQSIGRNSGDLVPYIDQTGGSIFLDKVHAIGSNFTSFIKKSSGDGQITVSNSNIEGNFLKLIDAPSGAKNVFFDQSNSLNLTDDSRFTLSTIKDLVRSRFDIGPRATSSVSGDKVYQTSYMRSYNKDYHVKTAFDIVAYTSSPLLRVTGLDSAGANTKWSIIEGNIVDSAAASFEMEWKITAYRQGVTPTPVKINADGRLTAATATLSGLPTYADNAAASAGGLTVGQLYKTAAGAVMVRV